MRVRTLIKEKVPGTQKLVWLLRDKGFRGTYGFHGDTTFQKFVSEIINSFKVTSFIETGSYLGDTCGFLAAHHKNLRIFTSEINERFYETAQERLARYRNVTCVRGDSRQFLADLINLRCLGNLPLFFLDAHWCEDWPLKGELELISRNIKQAIVLIDDFQIPGSTYLAYHVQGDRVCGFDLLEALLFDDAIYGCLYPSYSYDSKPITGYVSLFQNVDEAFAAFKEKPFVKRYFVYTTPRC